MRPPRAAPRALGARTTRRPSAAGGHGWRHRPASAPGAPAASSRGTRQRRRGRAQARACARPRAAHPSAAASIPTAQSRAAAAPASSGRREAQRGITADEHEAVEIGARQRRGRPSYSTAFARGQPCERKCASARPRARSARRRARPGHRAAVRTRVAEDRHRRDDRAGANSSSTERPSAAAIASAASTLGRCSPASIAPTACRLTPAAAANADCHNPAVTRASRNVSDTPQN